MYIGETEKNLDLLFDEIGSASAVLFFDEADALISKRTQVRDSHDRYANIEVSYLLERTELYDNIAVLSTNLRSGDLDDPIRRYTLVVDVGRDDA